MKIYLQNSLLLDKNRFVVVTRSFVPRFALHCLVASAYGRIEGNIAHLRTRSCCGTECRKNALRNVGKMPYVLQKCPKTLQECPMCCNNALNILRKCPNFTMHILIIIKLTHSKNVLENTVEIQPQAVALDFKNLSQYSSRSK